MKKKHKNLRGVISLLISLCFNIVIIVLLLIFAVKIIEKPDDEINVNNQQLSNEVVEEIILEDNENLGEPKSEIKVRAVPQIVSDNDVGFIFDQNTTSSNNFNAGSRIGGGMSKGYSIEGKANLLSVEEEDMKKNSFDWLISKQSSNGFWGGDSRETRRGIYTGIVLKAFLDYGYSMYSEKYGKSLLTGVKWLYYDLKKSDFQERGDGYTYAYPISLQVLLKSYFYTRNYHLEVLLHEVVDTLESYQQNTGGYAYEFVKGRGIKSDLGVSTWVLAYLNLYQYLGVDEIIDKKLNNIFSKLAKFYAKSYYKDDGYYSFYYKLGLDKKEIIYSLSQRAIGLNGMLMLQKGNRDFSRQIETVFKDLVVKKSFLEDKKILSIYNFYYYASALFYAKNYFYKNNFKMKSLIKKREKGLLKHLRSLQKEGGEGVFWKLDKKTSKHIHSKNYVQGGIDVYSTAFASMSLAILDGKRVDRKGSKVVGTSNVEKVVGFDNNSPVEGFEIEVW